MARFIIKLGELYTEYSTVTDSIVIPGMAIERYKRHYRNLYGAELHPKLLARIEQFGTSEADCTLRETLSCNRCGKNETWLTAQQIYDFLRSGEPLFNRPIGLKWTDDDEYNNARLDRTLIEDGTRLIESGQ